MVYLSDLAFFYVRTLSKKKTMDGLRPQYLPSVNCLEISAKVALKNTIERKEEEEIAFM